MTTVPAYTCSQSGMAWVPLGSVPFRLDGLLRTTLELANRRPSERPKEIAVLLHGVLDWVHRLDHPDILAMLKLTPDEAELIHALLAAHELGERRSGLPVTWERRRLEHPVVELRHAPWSLVDRGEGWLGWWWLPVEAEDTAPARHQAYSRVLAGRPVRVGVDALVAAAHAWRGGRESDLDWETWELDPRLDYDAGPPAKRKNHVAQSGAGPHAPRPAPCDTNALD